MIVGVHSGADEYRAGERSQREVNRVESMIDCRDLVAEQLEILKRSGGPSKVDTWYTGLGKYLVSTGTLQTAPEPQSFIEPKYMEMVAKDAKLRAFADDKPM